MVEVLSDGPRTAAAQLLLAHGAGAAMTSPFMTRIAAMLAEQGVRVHRFEFGYMAARRTSDKKRPPPKAETLAGEYLAAIAQVRKSLPKRGGKLFIGGKSMGGRVASLVGDEAFTAGDVAGLVCLGYPFHPIGKPDKLRTAHLADLRCPALIVQGTRDLFGTIDEVKHYKLSPSITMHWLEGGDHDFKGAGRGAMDGVVAAVTEFCR